MPKFEYEIQKGYRIRIEVTGFIETYALKFFKIYNYVKDYRGLRKIYTDIESDVFVICDEGYENKAVKWFSKFGEVKEITPVTIISPLIDISDMNIDIENCEILETTLKDNYI